MYVQKCQVRVQPSPNPKHYHESLVLGLEVHMHTREYHLALFPGSSHEVVITSWEDEARVQPSKVVGIN